MNRPKFANGPAIAGISCGKASSRHWKLMGASIQLSSKIKILVPLLASIALFRHSALLGLDSEIIFRIPDSLSLVFNPSVEVGEVTINSYD